MDTLLNDIRFALRSLGKSKMFTAVALLSLALGIGANVTVFSIVSALAFKPLPYAEPDRLVDLHEWSATKLCGGCGVGTSYPGFIEWRDRVRLGRRAWAHTPSDHSPSPAPSRRSASAARSSPRECSTCSACSRSLGREFSDDEDRVGGAPVVMLSHALWTRRYGADRRVVGQTIRVNGLPHTVIGVMPPASGFPRTPSCGCRSFRTPPVGARPARLRRRRAAARRRVRRAGRRRDALDREGARGSLSRHAERVDRGRHAAPQIPSCNARVGVLGVPRRHRFRAAHRLREHRRPHARARRQSPARDRDPSRTRRHATKNRSTRCSRRASFSRSRAARSV